MQKKIVYKDLLGLVVSVGDTVAIAQPKGISSLVISTVVEVSSDGRWIKVKGNGNRKYKCLKITSLPEDSMIISCKRFEQLQADAEHLNQLKNAGVDNWSEYFSYQEVKTNE